MSEPIWRTAAEQVRLMCKARDWGPGHKIPSRIQLAKELHVSGATMLRALRHLVAQGVLTDEKTAPNRIDYRVARVTDVP